MDSEPKQVVIIGAGLVGVLTAYFISKRGNCRVTVLERGNEVASGTSFANAGRFALANYAQGPTARPDKVGAAFSTLVPSFLRTSEPKPTSDDTGAKPPFVHTQGAKLTPSLVEWGVWFLRNCTPGAFDYNKQSTMLLSHHALEAMSEVLEKIDLAKIHHADSGVTIFSKPEKFNSTSAKASIVNAFGEGHQQQCSGALRTSWEVLSCSECVRRYPWLQQWRNASAPAVPTAKQLEQNIAGCIANGEFTVDARLFTQAVAKLAIETGRVRFCYNEEVEACHLH
jgi:glycine/D-amino acid oxidase-like deaminating enzyme